MIEFLPASKEISMAHATVKARPRYASVLRSLDSIALPMLWNNQAGRGRKDLHLRMRNT